MAEKEKRFNPYLFEKEFSSLSAMAKAPEVPKPLTFEDIAQAEADGYAKGLADGKEQATEDFNQTLAQQSTVLFKLLSDITTLQNQAFKYAVEHLTPLLGTALDTLLGDARKNYPTDLAERTLTLIKEQTKHPTLNVATAAHTNAYLQQTLLKGKTTNQITFNIDPTLAEGDCVLTWPQGGAEVNHAELCIKIAAVFTQMAQNTAEDLSQSLNISAESSASSATSAEIKTKTEASHSLQEEIPPSPQNEDL